LVLGDLTKLDDLGIAILPLRFVAVRLRCCGHFR